MFCNRLWCIVHFPVFMYVSGIHQSFVFQVQFGVYLFCLVFTIHQRVSKRKFKPERLRHAGFGSRSARARC